MQICFDDFLIKKKNEMKFVPFGLSLLQLVRHRAFATKSSFSKTSFASVAGRPDSLSFSSSHSIQHQLNISSHLSRMTSKYVAVEKGVANSSNYRLFFSEYCELKLISQNANNLYKLLYIAPVQIRFCVHDL